MSNVIDDRGYVIVAMDSHEQMAAAACSYSIKIKDKNAKVAIVLPYVDSLEEHIEPAFDYVVQLPYGYDEIRRVNDWQLYWATPFKYNIVIDVYTLVQTDLSPLWDTLSAQHKVAFTQRTYDFKHLSRSLNDIHDDIDIEFVPSSMWFFVADDEESLEYFKLADPILQNWQDVIDSAVGKQYRKKYYQPDFMNSIILDRIWDNKRFITDKFEYVSMSASIHDFDNLIEESWADYINFWITNNCRLKVQNYNIDDVFCYVNKEIMTWKIYEQYRNYYQFVSK